jgi:hypothetical protein
MPTQDYPLSSIRSQTHSFLRNCFFLSAIITLYSSPAISQVKIHERVTIQTNKLGADSTGEYLPGQKVISRRINTSMQTTGTMITVPESSYVTITVVSASSAATIDLILRSPFNQTIIPNASGNVGAKWESPFFSTETVLDVGIFWVWRNYSGYEYGVEMTQVAENEYILYFEDIGDLYGHYIDYDDLVVDVRVHGKPDHFSVTVDPDSILYYEGTYITAVAIDNEGNEMLLGDNAIMTLSAEPSSTGSFYPSKEVLYGDLRNGYVSYSADQEQSPCTQDVVVTVSGEGASGTANVVVKGSPCIVMSTSSDKIHPGESVDITMEQLDCSGNLMPYPPDQYFYVWMNSDPKYGKLRDQSGNEDWFVGGVQPFTFVAANSIDGDTAVVEIEAWAWSGGGGAQRIAGVGVKDTLGNPPIASTTLNATLMKLAKLEEKLKKRLAEVKVASPVPPEPVSLGVKYTTAQTNAKDKLMIASEAVTDCRSVVHVTIKGSELVILDHSPWSIWPWLPAAQRVGISGYDPKRGFIIEVVRGINQQPVKDESVVIKAEFIPMSGGHDHNDPELPTSQQGRFYGQGESGNPLIVKTDISGRAVVDSFVASQIAGRYIVTASLAAASAIRDTVNLTVAVPGLELLPEGQNYMMVGGTCKHNGPSDRSLGEVPENCRTSDNNHWIQSGASGSLQRAAETFRSAEWNKTREVMRLNDISLPFGGLFDINGNWEKPHDSHRTGKDIDIENLARLDRLRQVLEKRQWTYVPEGPSFFAHFRFH